MRGAESIQIVFASVLGVAAWIWPLPLTRRMKASLLALLVLLANLVARLIVRSVPPLYGSVFRDWLPAALFLIPYWQSGQFFTAPNTALEQKLARFDRQLSHVFLGPLGSSCSGRCAALVEIVYLTVYPLIPVGLAILYLKGMRGYADYYWTFVLLATYPCYAITPFFPALPPRLLAPGEGPHDFSSTRLRRLNAWIVRKLSIRAITFPSAHVASAVAVSLILLQLTPVVGVITGCVAVAIAIACVLGGYHYIADVLAGTLIALVVSVTVPRIIGP
jgi:membrane-associated phospholipid phosphatase